MSAGDWEGFPPVGTRVRVPHAPSTIEGEVVLLHHLYGKPLARVRIRVPVYYGPYDSRAIDVSFDRDDIEVIDAN